MAAARPLVGRSSVAENIIKQGYLKKSVRSSDPIQSATKQLATNIKQKLEPNRWYVFGVRYGKPYLEYFESEERVFSGSPMETFDLSSYRNLTYTLGRTNTNFTFCIFLEWGTIELTAPNRAQMLDWCRSLERHLRNLGIGNKKAKEDHMYSAFPVQNKGKKSAEVLEEEALAEAELLAQDNIYEDAEGLKEKDENHNEPLTPPLPPRPAKRGAFDDEENVFASICSVHKLPENEYKNTGDDADRENIDRDYLDLNGDSAELCLGVRDNTKGSEVKSRDKLGEFCNGAIGGKDLDDDDNCEYFDFDKSGGVDSDDDDESRCSSLPTVPPRHQPEPDTSEDSDFVAVSFWLRNRKSDEMAQTMDDSDIDVVKHKLQAVPQSTDTNANGPPLPQRRHTVKSGRQCMSMYVDPKNDLFDSGDFCDKPIARSRGTKNLDKKLTKSKSEVDSKGGYEKDILKSPDKSKTVNGFIRVSVDSLKDSPHFVDEGECYEDVAKPYPQKPQREELAVLPMPHAEGSVAEDNPIYETTWGGGATASRVSDCSKSRKNTSEDRENEEQAKTGAKSKKSSLRKLSKKFTRKSKPLPDALVVTLPPARDESNTKEKSVCCSEEPLIDTSNQPDGNMYSDFPEGPSNGHKTIGDPRTRNTDLDSDIQKMSNETEPKSGINTSPVLPKRNLSKSMMSRSQFGTDSKPLVPNNLSQSCKDSYYSIPPSDIEPFYEPFGEPSLPPSPPVKSTSDQGANSYIYDNPPREIPIAPPRRNRKTVQDTSNNTYAKDQGANKTLITSKQESFESAATLPMRGFAPETKLSSPDEPPLPPRIDSLPERPPPPLPPMRRSEKPEIPPHTSGSRPKSSFNLTRSHSQLGTNLKQNQVDILKSERDSTGGMVRTIPKVHFQSGIALVQCFEKVWIAGWDVKKFPRLYDKFHIGDELISINDVQVSDLTFVSKLIKNVKADHIEVTVRRLPNARIYAIQRSAEGESLGIKREGGTAEIVYVDPNGLASKYGLMSKANTMTGTGLCNWVLTEINMRPLNLYFKDQEIEHRLNAVGRDISIVVQPQDFIKELKKQLKKTSSYKDFLIK